MAPPIGPHHHHHPLTYFFWVPTKFLFKTCSWKKKSGGKKSTQHSCLSFTRHTRLLSRYNIDIYKVDWLQVLRWVRHSESDPIDLLICGSKKTTKNLPKRNGEGGGRCLGTPTRPGWRVSAFRPTHRHHPHPSSPMLRHQHHPLSSLPRLPVCHYHHPRASPHPPSPTQSCD